MRPLEWGKMFPHNILGFRFLKISWPIVNQISDNYYSNTIVTASAYILYFMQFMNQFTFNFSIYTNNTYTTHIQNPTPLFYYRIISVYTSTNLSRYKMSIFWNESHWAKNFCYICVTIIIIYNYHINRNWYSTIITKSTIHLY